MFHRSLAALVLSTPLFAACGVLPDITLGAAQGIPPISGSTTVAIPAGFMCGDKIMDAKYGEVTTSGTAAACTFTFKQDVTALKASDYDNKPELKGAQLVNGVDIDVKKLAIKDGTTMTDLAPISLDGKAFGTTIFTEADLKTALPFTKRVEGAPVDALKSTIEEKKDLVIPVNVVVVVMLPALPAKIGLEYEAQPNLVIGF